MNITLPLTVKMMKDKSSSDAPFVAYAPELDIASCGPNEAKARQNLHEAIDITLEEVAKKGQLEAFLQELGFERKNKQWTAPRVHIEPFLFHVSF